MDVITDIVMEGRTAVHMFYQQECCAICSAHVMVTCDQLRNTVTFESI